MLPRPDTAGASFSGIGIIPEPPSRSGYSEATHYWFLVRALLGPGSSVFGAAGAAAPGSSASLRMWWASPESAGRVR